jgi:hypothetical protein
MFFFELNGILPRLIGLIQTISFALYL